ncbi:MAG TPA: inorganic diphosphatase [Anaerolineae bacterium]|nr:inorganic diphosphatase [Anaerolineae bacterium]HOQ97727.1 inorganic diphosphatase [Anaerolineae bacterium]HPL27299.1 inorganic diphosphatase [Anaerolineae bacterium]
MAQLANLWTDLSPGPDVPRTVHVVVEIPKGSRNKYEYDEHMGVFKLDRVLYSPLHYPGDYGLVPQTLAEDGDALDVLVMVTEPTFPGCVIQARPLGLFRMLDRGVPDNKVLAVPATDPLFADAMDLGDVPRHFLAEVAHFFKTYKDLEGIGVEPLGWEPAAAARQDIALAARRYRDRRSLSSDTAQA